MSMTYSVYTAMRYLGAAALVFQFGPYNLLVKIDFILD